MKKENDLTARADQQSGARQLLMEISETKKAPAKQAPAETTGEYRTAWRPATYVDEAGQRQTGLTEAEAPYWGRMEDWYEQLYQDSLRTNAAEAEEAAARAARTAEEGARALDEQTRGTNRQLYRDYMERQRVLPQQLAAEGYSGGLSESARIRLTNSYEEALAENERSRGAQLAALETERARQESAARSAARAADSQAAQNRYAALAALQQEQYRQQRSDAEKRAALLAEAGDYSGYVALGLSEEEAAYLEQMWRRKNPRLARRR